MSYPFVRRGAKALGQLSLTAQGGRFAPAGSRAGL